MKTDLSAAIAALEPILARADAEAKAAMSLEDYDTPCRVRWMLGQAMEALRSADAAGFGIALPDESPEGIVS